MIPYYTISYNILANSLKDNWGGYRYRFLFEYTRDTIEHHKTIHKNNPYKIHNNTFSKNTLTDYLNSLTDYLYSLTDYLYTLTDC